MKARWLRMLALALCLALLVPAASASELDVPVADGIESVESPEQEPEPEEIVAAEDETDDALPVEDTEAEVIEAVSAGDESDDEALQDEDLVAEATEPESAPAADPDEEDPGMDLEEALDEAELAELAEEAEALALEALEMPTLPKASDPSNPYFEYEVRDGGAVITAYTGDLYSDTLEVPDTLGGWPVVGIGYTGSGSSISGAFQGVHDLCHIKLPSTLKSIGARAFYETPLKEITIPNSVTSIDMWAFAYCTDLAKVTFGSGLQELGAQAFINAGLQSVTIPASVTTMGTGVFMQCGDLTTATVNCKGALGDFAFHKCTNLTKVTIGAGVTAIGQCAFNMCTWLPRVDIPGNVKRIGQEAFLGCAKLETVNIANGVTEIGERAFGGKPEYGYEAEKAGVPVKTLVLPASLTTVGKLAFAYCNQLTSVTVKGSKLGEYMFFQCSKLNTLNLGTKLDRVPAQAFAYCRALKRVVVPGTAKVIEEGAFQCCDSLSLAILEKGVTTLSVYAFAFCPKLGLIAVPTTVKSIHDQAFYGITTTQPEVQVNPRVEIASPAGSYGRKWGIARGLKTIDGVITMTGNASKTVYVTQQYKIDVGSKAISTCSSSNKKVAAVSKAGRIKLKKAGTAKITVKLTNGKKWVLTLKVKDPTIPKKVSFDLSGTQSLYLGEKLNLRKHLILTRCISNVAVKTGLSWRSSNTKVAKVSRKGVVTPIKTGTVTITVKAKRGGKSAKIKVNVKDPKKPKKIEFMDLTGHYIHVGDRWDARLNMIITWPKPSLAPKYPAWKSWTSSNTKVATVSSKGIVTAKKPGTVTITVVTANGKKASATMLVKPQDDSMG